MPSQIENIFSKIHDRLILFRYILPFIKKNEKRVISPQNTLCLFCQPRGGSTWLAEIFLHISNSILIDEPLWRGKVNVPFKKPDHYTRKVPKISDLDFFFNQYIPEDVDWPEARMAFEDILSGRVISIGLYNEGGLKKLKNGNYYITKFCYANLLLPWLIDRFDFNAILLTRHPCAVVASQLKYPVWRDINIEEFRKIDDFRFNQIYYSALEKVGKIDSKEKYLALQWALGFKHTAMNPRNNKRWLTISYEGLLNNYSHEIERISNRFSFDLDNLNIDSSTPSKSTQPTSLKYMEEGQQLSSWKKELTGKQISTIFNVLEKFDIDIYTKEVEPEYERLYSNEKIL